MTVSETDGQEDFEQQLINRADRRGGEVGVERINDPAVMRKLVAHEISHAKHEICSTLPAGPYPVEVLRSSWEADVSLLNAGVMGAIIYQADAVRTPEVLRYLTEFAAAGAKVRVAHRVTHRTVIIDRRLVLVAVHNDTMKVPFLLIKEPALVHNFRDQFAATWRSAHSVGVGPEDSLADETVREILAILSSGVTDDVAARQLGVSARTVRRRMAAVLDLLGASSRFEAGAKAVQSGWL